MNLSSISFILIYFPILFLLYYSPIVKTTRAQNIVLIVATICFYAFSEPLYVFLLLFIILISFYASKLDLKYSCMKFGNTAIFIDIVILLTAKNFNRFFDLVNTDYNSISIPLGLSYFILNAIAFIIESRKDIRFATTNLVEGALYMINFMTIVSGPVGSYSLEMPQIRERKVELSKINEGFWRFAIGLIKKVIIADSLMPLVEIWSTKNEISFIFAWVGVLANIIELYFDFSGYTDMAIGIGKVFGIDLPENFYKPFAAESVSEFWRRWHMSLSQWFVRYIYIPLGGSRVNSNSRHIINIGAVWILTICWHGIKWTYIVWGLINFCFIVLEKFTCILDRINKMRIGKIYTFVVALIGFMFLNAIDFSHGISHLKMMLGIGCSTFVSAKELKTMTSYIIPMILGMLFAFVYPSKLIDRINNDRKATISIQIVVFVLFVVSIISIIGRGYTAPLYAGF